MKRHLCDLCLVAAKVETNIGPGSDTRIFIRSRGWCGDQHLELCLAHREKLLDWLSSIGWKAS